MFRYQKTLNQKIVFTGKGLHTGRIVRMEVLPADANHGIVFQRVDNENAAPVEARSQNISSTELCTIIGSGSSSVSTIEHLMAAFAGLGIDNVLVKVNAPEVPIMDGSSNPFIIEFLRIGTCEQKIGRRYFVVKETFEYKEGDRYIRIEPARATRFKCSIDFGKSFIGKQSVEMGLSTKEFLKLAQSRTFCHVNEVNALRAAGLALGGSLENAIVVTDTGVMNSEGLRSEDEFVKHKLLDCIGDLALLGGPIVGKITVHKPGHSLHANFMNELMLKRDKYLSVFEDGAFRKSADLEEIAMLGALVSYG